MNLGYVLRKWRESTDTGLREAGKLMNVPYSTLARFERTGDCDSNTLSLILRWLLTGGKAKR